jgi:hypothetical protein
MSQHILLSSMGAGDPRPTRYQMKDQPVTSSFSSLALWQLLDASQRPDEVWFLLTEKAREKAWDEIQAEATRLGVAVKTVPLGGESELDDASLFLERTAHAIPDGATLTLDVTQGLRHHAFLFFALALYVSKFRKNKLAGIFYSRLETEPRDAVKPVIDLKPVLELARWFIACDAFRATGSTAPIAELVKDKRAQVLFCDFSQSFLTGLPIEAGGTAAKLVEKLSSDGFSLADMPLEADLRKLLLDEIKPLAGGFKQKPELVLDPQEILRQRCFIERYLRTGQDNLAFGLMREWVVNRVLASRGTKAWLKLSEREAVENQLGCLKALKAQKNDPNRAELSQELSELATDWDHLSDLRNALMHHGMREEGLPQKPIKKLKGSWQDKPTWGTFPEIGGGCGKLLICPLGNAPGVLFSAIRHTKPDRCLVICSKTSMTSIDEASSKSQFRPEILPLVMDDPHSGIGEFKGLLDKARCWLFEADALEVNLTGGTSLMGVLAGRLLEHGARTYRRTARRFVMVDRRSTEEQKNDPWVEGEITYLDTPTALEDIND